MYSLKERVSFFNIQINPFPAYVDVDYHIQSIPVSKLGKTL
jgi:hypothetical protein